MPTTGHECRYTVRERNIWLAFEAMLDVGLTCDQAMRQVQEENPGTRQEFLDHLGGEIHGWPPQRIKVAEVIEYTDRSLPTACNWERYEIQPGEYEVFYHFSYRKVKVQAKLVEEYYVNRLFTASSVAEQSHRVGQIFTITVPAWVVGL